jgi:hypothetical protein
MALVGQWRKTLTAAIFTGVFGIWREALLPVQIEFGL